MSTYRANVVAIEKLNALIGLPATNIWQTTVTAHRGDVWRDSENGNPSMCVMSKEFPSSESARKWAEKEAKNLNRRHQ